MAWGDKPAIPDESGRGEPLGRPHSPSNEAAAKSAIETELAQWQRFALNRLGQADGRAFEVRAIPDELAFEISAGLLFAQDRESVKRVFAGAVE